MIYHYFCASNGKIYPLYKTANSDYGFMYVTSFFCISGGVFYFNYSKILSIKSFYYKRWKSVLVPYYVCYFYFFLTNAFKSHMFFYKENLPYLFLTIIGLDGYPKYKIKTYYLVGEVFSSNNNYIYIISNYIIFGNKK